MPATTLYFNPVVDGNWSSLGNWFTDLAGTIPYGGTDTPWTVDDLTKGYDLDLATGGTPPTIDTAVTIGNGFTITGTCLMSINYNNTTIYGGTYSANVGNSGTISGGTFSFPNMILGASITGGTFTGNGQNAQYGSCTISGGTFSGTGFIVDGGTIINDGHFTGSGFVCGNTGTIYGGIFDGDVTSSTFSASFVIYGGTFNSTVNIQSIIVGGTFNYGVTTNNDIGGGEIFGTYNTSFNNIGYGIFHGDVNFNSMGMIQGGIFYGTVYGYAVYAGGTYYGTVYDNFDINNYSGAFYGDVIISFGNTITFGYFYNGTVTNYSGGSINGGIFYGKLDNQGTLSNGASLGNLKAFRYFDSPFFTIGKGINGSGILGII